MLEYKFNNTPDFSIDITSISRGYGFEVNMMVKSKPLRKNYVEEIQRTYKFPAENIFNQLYYGYWRNKGRFLEKIQPYLTWSSKETENTLINNQQGELFQMSSLEKVKAIEKNLGSKSYFYYASSHDLSNIDKGTKIETFLVGDGKSQPGNNLPFDNIQSLKRELMNMVEHNKNNFDRAYAINTFTGMMIAEYALSPQKSNKGYQLEEINI